MAAPNCYQCAHFKITHEQNMPRACQVFGFKGKELPSHAIFNVTGKHCPYFTPKPGALPEAPDTREPAFPGNASDGWVA